MFNSKLLGHEIYNFVQLSLEVSCNLFYAMLCALYFFKPCLLESCIQHEKSSGTQNGDGTYFSSGLLNWSAEERQIDARNPVRNIREVPYERGILEVYYRSTKYKKK